MVSNKKILLSRWLIFISVFIAISFEIYNEALTVLSPRLPAIDINSPIITVIGLIVLIFFVAGMFFGSRSIEQPLSVRLFFKLLYSYPSKLILIPYIILGILTIIYLKLTC
jgi:hypothetical protein